MDRGRRPTHLSAAQEAGQPVGRDCQVPARAHRQRHQESLELDDATQVRAGGGVPEAPAACGVCAVLHRGAAGAGFTGVQQLRLQYAVADQQHGGTAAGATVRQLK